jgi:mannitol-specific phosphotransferase system IIBC component
MLKFRVIGVSKMMNEGKYKRWAWGALIGLGVVIVVSGLIMTMTLSSPKPTDESAKTASTQTTSEEKNEKTTKESKTDDSTTKDNKNTENKSKTTEDATKNSSSEKQSDGKNTDSSMTVNNPPATTTPTTNASDSKIPKTGPEEAIVPILGIAACAYLFALNVSYFKKNA